MGKILLPASLIGVGFAFVILSVIMGFVVVPNIIEDKIKDEVSLVNGTDTWDKWETNPVPIYFKFYIFNVTNPDEVNNGSKPILQETGPYAFREERVKHVMEIDEEEDTITYYQTIDYFYDPEESGGRSLDDSVNVVNLPLMAIATNLYGKLGPIGRGIIRGLVDSGEAIVRKDVTVGQLTFDGYPILPAYGQILSLVGEIPPEFANDTFGFYKGKNGTDDGIYKIYAGIKDTNNFGKMITWNNEELLSWWATPREMWNGPTAPETDKYCNAINGTDGGIFAPFIEKDTIVRIFVTDICRSIHFEYKGEESHEGINGLKFGFPDSFYEDPKVNGDNYCFCPSPEPGLGKLDTSCTKGVIRIFPCQNDAPLVTSSPHFHRADPKFLEMVDGLLPQEGVHDTWALLEPNSGMLLKISKKLQINVEMQNFSGGLNLPMFDDIENYLFPIFYADESATLDKENADDLKGKLLTPLKIVGITKWVIIALGAVLVAGGVFVVIKRM